MPCEIKEFFDTYLGIPLSIRKPTNSELVPLIDKVSNKLPGWKATLLNRAGRHVLVKVVLSSIPIYSMLSLDLPKWVLKAIDKRRRGFLWKGQNNANGGSCPFAWEAVARPIQFGGLAFLTWSGSGGPCVPLALDAKDRSFPPLGWSVSPGASRCKSIIRHSCGDQGG